MNNAKKALGVSQSSVSARITALEDTLGVVLFDSNTRGVRLAEAGRRFVERIAAGVNQIDHVVKTASLAVTGEHGRLCVGVHGLFPVAFLTIC